ncbi:MAG: ribosome-associated translation inhibitor RaiA [Candidatus Omnitrophica bacterium]|nr:ribosome-associated translation inhibitor RaiA [Candidatus Omnitrophota bacterium]
MRISLTGRHFDVDADLKAYVEKQIDKLNRYYHHIISVHVILDAEKFRQRAEIVLALKKQTLKVQEVTSDIHSSIDRALKKLEGKLKRFEEKIKLHRKV